MVILLRKKIRLVVITGHSKILIRINQYVPDMIQQCERKNNDDHLSVCERNKKDENLRSDENKVNDNYSSLQKF